MSLSKSTTPDIIIRDYVEINSFSIQVNIIDIGLEISISITIYVEPSGRGIIAFT